MVSEWPPTSGTVTSFGSAPVNWAIKVAARTESNVDTPITLPGHSRPECFNTSHANGTNEFTGFVISNKMASGEYCAIAYKVTSLTSGLRLTTLYFYWSKKVYGHVTSFDR